MSDDVLVAIVHFGNPEVTATAVRSVRRLDPAPQHIAVIANADNITEQVLGVSVVRMGSNRGYAGAVNAAASVADSRGCAFVWILNNDTEVRPDSVAVLLDAAQASPEAAVVGSYVTAGSTCYFGGGTFDRRTGRAGHLHFGAATSSLPRGGVVGSDWINGCSMFVRTAVLLTRPFDESLFLYKEELEWQVRSPALQARLVREPLVDHGVGLTTGSTDGTLGRVFMARNGLILARRQSAVLRVGWTFAWVSDFVLRPLAKGRVGAVRDHLRGARARAVPGPELVADLLR